MNNIILYKKLLTIEIDVLYHYSSYVTKERELLTKVNIKNMKITDVMLNWWKSLGAIGRTDTILTQREKVTILMKGLVPLSMIVIIIGGILSGIMTATESAAVASVYITILGFFLYRNITIRTLIKIAIDTANLTATVMFCVETASLFGWLMSYYNILGVTSELFQFFTTSPTIFLLFVIVLFLFLGTFMDPTPVMLIFVPILASLVPLVGVNALQMGILICYGSCDWKNYSAIWN